MQTLCGLDYKATSDTDCNSDLSYRRDRSQQVRLQSAVWVFRAPANTGEGVLRLA